MSLENFIKNDNVRAVVAVAGVVVICLTVIEKWYSIKKSKLEIEKIEK